MIVCWVYSLESPRWGDSGEYTQHTIPWYNKKKNKKKKTLNIFFLSYWKDFVGTEKRVRIVHGKRAIRVRAIEVILYIFDVAAQVNTIKTWEENKKN